MSKTIADRIKVCPTCKHFIFKDDTIDFCSNCFNPIEPDLDIEIIEYEYEMIKPSIFKYILSWLLKE